MIINNMRPFLNRSHLSYKIKRADLLEYYNFIAYGFQVFFNTKVSHAYKCILAGDVLQPHFCGHATLNDIRS